MSYLVYAVVYDLYTICVQYLCAHSLVVEVKQAIAREQEKHYQSPNLRAILPLPPRPLPHPAMPLTIIRKSLQKRTTRSRRSTRTNRTMRRSRNWESSIAKPDRPSTASESSEIQDSRQVAGFMSQDSLEAKGRNKLVMLVDWC